MLFKKAKKYIDYIIVKITQKIRQKEYKYNGERIKYLLYRNKESKDLIIVFSSCTRVGIKARYNYVRTLKKINANKLFILDDGASDNRGTYYLGVYPEFEFEKATISLVDKIYKETNPTNTFFIGSSKGGYSALNFGVKYSESKIIIGAPQYFLGTYLNNMKNNVTIKSMNCLSSKAISYLDNYLYSQIKEYSNNNSKVFLQYSKNDITYDEHIKYLIEDLHKHDYELSIQILDYKNHDDVSLSFPQYILNCLKIYIGGDSN